ncbi:hypothetical protein LBMAG42_07200 [Deltaproteobacteria bacterium]|nr:hypothetical protein LBMAG42_07200 [Deltaproteobacteria bacterium]
MTRFVLAAFVSLVLVSVAFADDVIGRDLSGATVVVATQPTVFVMWSMDDASAVADLKAVDALRVKVVAVNVDGASRRAEITPFLRAHGLKVEALADPTGSVRARIGAGPGVGAVSVTTAGSVAWRTSDVRAFLAAMSVSPVVAAR